MSRETTRVRIITHETLRNLKALMPDAGRPAFYEFVKAYIRAKNPSPSEYEAAIRFVLEWMEA